MKDKTLNLQKIVFYYEDDVRFVLTEEKNPKIGKIFYDTLIKKHPDLNWSVENKDKAPKLLKGFKKWFTI